MALSEPHKCESEHCTVVLPVTNPSRLCAICRPVESVRAEMVAAYGSQTKPVPAQPVSGPGVLLPTNDAYYPPKHGELPDRFRGMLCPNGCGAHGHPATKMVRNGAAIECGGCAMDPPADRWIEANRAPERPIVRHGDVAAQLCNELTSLFRHYGALLAFEAKVAEAAKSPAAWLALREEVRR